MKAIVLMALVFTGALTIGALALTWTASTAAAYCSFNCD